MKKVSIIMLSLLAVVILVVSVFAIREMVLLKQKTVYNLRAIYNEYNLDTVTQVIPNMEIVYSEEHQITVGSLRRNDKNELIVISKPGNKEIESIIYFTDIKCGKGIEMDTNLFRQVGLQDTFPAKRVGTYIPASLDSNNLFSIYYKSLFNDDLINMTCSLEDEEDISTLYFEIMNTSTFAEVFDIPEDQVWNELEILEYY